MSQSDLPRGHRSLGPRSRPDRPPEGGGRPLPDFRHDGSARSPEDLLDRLRHRLDRLAANHPSASPADLDHAEPASRVSAHAEHPVADETEQAHEASGAEGSGRPGEAGRPGKAERAGSAGEAGWGMEAGTAEDEPGDGRDGPDADGSADPAAGQELADAAAADRGPADPELMAAGLVGWGDFLGGDWGSGELEPGPGGGEPYRPWFMGGEPLAPWFTDDLGE